MTSTPNSRCLLQLPQKEKSHQFLLVAHRYDSLNYPRNLLRGAKLKDFASDRGMPPHI
jgi:hypothetical protein